MEYVRRITKHSLYALDPIKALCHHLCESPLKLLTISRGCLVGRPSLKIKKRKDNKGITKHSLDALDPIKALCHHLRESRLKSLTTSKQESWSSSKLFPKWISSGGIDARHNSSWILVQYGAKNFVKLHLNFWLLTMNL